MHLQVEPSLVGIALSQHFVQPPIEKNELESQTQPILLALSTMLSGQTQALLTIRIRKIVHRHSDPVQVASAGQFGNGIQVYGAAK